MLLFLKYNKCVEVVEDITLRDGCISVVNHLPAFVAGTDEPLEPAQWYKTLVVEAVYVDCNRKEIKWTRLNYADQKGANSVLSKKKDFTPEHAERLHNEIEMFDFDIKTAELFDKAVDVMVAYANKRTCKKLIKTEVVKLLHCYILPLLKLFPVDVPALENVLTYITSQHEQIELRLLAKTKESQRMENSLHTQRENILFSEDFKSEKYVQCCQHDFLAVFVTHLEKDIHRINAQLKEHDAKYLETVSLNGSQHNTHSNSKCRHNGSIPPADDKLQKLLTIVTVIKKVMTKQAQSKKMKHKNRTVKRNITHDIYMEMNSRLQQQKDDVRCTIVKKVNISSVREAVYGTLSILKKTSESSGMSRSNTIDSSEYSGSIISLHAKPADWNTLEEKLMNYLSDDSTDVCTEHVTSCQRIRGLVQTCLDEATMLGSETRLVEDDWELLQASLEVPGDFILMKELTSYSNQMCECCSLTNILSEQSSNTQDVLPENNLKSALETVIKSVQDHLENMCGMLHKGIANLIHDRKRIWLLYEPHFSLECLSALVDLYQTFLLSTCQAVYNTVSTLSLYDIIGEDETVLKLAECSINPNKTINLRTNGDSHCHPTSTGLENNDCSVQTDSGGLAHMFYLDPCEQVDTTSNCASPTSIKPESSFREEDEIAGSSDRLTAMRADHKNILSYIVAPVADTLKTFLKAKTISTKLGKLARVFSEIGGLTGTEEMSSCDDMLSMTIVLLCCLDAHTFVSVYANIKLLRDLMPDFLEGTLHDIAITNFEGAYTILFNQLDI